MMLGEKNSGPNALSQQYGPNATTAQTKIWWSYANVSQTGNVNNLMFLWQNGSSGPVSGFFFQSTPANSSATANHPGLAIATFFDGHTQSLGDRLPSSVVSSFQTGP